MILTTKVAKAITSMTTPMITSAVLFVIHSSFLLQTTAQSLPYLFRKETIEIEN
jgi:hypothetical protein